MEDEGRKRDALIRLNTERKKSKDVTDLNVEIAVADRVILKAQESLIVLRAPNTTRKTELLQKYKRSLTASDTKGHLFIQRQFFKPTDCGMCLESLYDTKNIALECSSCKIICHKFCRANLDISCKNMDDLKNTPPMYFLAIDVAERARWVQGLAHYRNEVELKAPLSGSILRSKTIGPDIRRLAM